MALLVSEEKVYEMIDIVHLINDTYQLIQFDDKGEIETIWFQGSLSDCWIYKEHEFSCVAIS